MTKKLTIEHIREVLLERNIELLSDTYVNNKTKLKLRCMKDGYEWAARWTHLRQGTGCPKCAGKAVPTLEHIREVLLEREIELLSDEYVDRATKLKLRCMKDNFVWKASWASLQQGSGCPKCAGKAKPTVEYIREFLKNKNIELLSNEYVNNSTKLKLRCTKDGHEWSATWTSLQQGYGCPKCSGKAKPTLEYIRQCLLDREIELLSDEYVGAHSKLKLKCLKDGHEWSAKWASLQQGYGCPRCAGLAVPTLEYIREVLHERGIELLDEKYKNSATKLKLRCMKDGHVWSAKWANLQQGTGCPRCSNVGPSNAEIRFREFIEPICREYPVIANDRKILNGKELDVYIPALSLAFEYNGNYFHQDPAKEKAKFRLAKEKGIRLIFVYDTQYQDPRYQYFYQKIISLIIEELINV